MIFNSKFVFFVSKSTYCIILFTIFLGCCFLEKGNAETQSEFTQPLNNKQKKERTTTEPNLVSNKQSGKKAASKKIEEMQLIITGLTDDLKKNVDARISILPKRQYQNSFYFRNRVKEEIEKGLNALGYYEPTINFDYDKDKNILMVTVEKGKPIYVQNIEINLLMQGENNTVFYDLINSALQQKGKILNQGDYDSFKNKLQSTALSQGYFDAVFTKRQLGISVARHEAFWWMDYDLKQRYQFGKIIFKNSQIRESYLQNIVPFKEGEFYTANQLALLNYNLSSTNWFESITIIPMRHKIERTDDSLLLPIVVELEPKKKNQLDIGIGYASDNGPRGSLRWNKPWINDRGHSLQAYTQISRIEKEYSLNYKIPLHKSAINDYYTFQGKYNKLDNNDTESTSYSIGVARVWERLANWQYSLGLNMLYDDFTQADDSYDTFLFYPSLSLSKTVSDDNLFPLNGHMQRYSVEVASQDVFSDIYLFRVQMQQVLIQTFKESHRFIARLNMGLINANEFDRVPPSFRFFAGGERSIRGYSYQSISPRDKYGQLTGGSRSVTASLEYNYKINEDWWGAAFVDSGEVVNNLKDDDFYTGAGVGIRWVSPVGPIKLDVAVPLHKDENGIHLYLGLGTDL